MHVATMRWTWMSRRCAGHVVMKRHIFFQLSSMRVRPSARCHTPIVHHNEGVSEKACLRSFIYLFIHVCLQYDMLCLINSYKIHSERYMHGKRAMITPGIYSFQTNCFNALTIGMEASLYSASFSSKFSSRWSSASSSSNKELNASLTFILHASAENCVSDIL